MIIDECSTCRASKYQEWIRCDLHDIKLIFAKSEPKPKEAQWKIEKNRHKKGKK